MNQEGFIHLQVSIHRTKDVKHASHAHKHYHGYCVLSKLHMMRFSQASYRHPSQRLLFRRLHFKHAAHPLPVRLLAVSDTDPKLVMFKVPRSLSVVLVSGKWTWMSVPIADRCRAVSCGLSRQRWYLICLVWCCTHLDPSSKISRLREYQEGPPRFQAMGVLAAVKKNKVGAVVISVFDWYRTLGRSRSARPTD